MALRWETSKTNIIPHFLKLKTPHLVITGWLIINIRIHQEGYSRVLIILIIHLFLEPLPGVGWSQSEYDLRLPTWLMSNLATIISPIWQPSLPLCDLLTEKSKCSRETQIRGTCPRAETHLYSSTAFSLFLTDSAPAHYRAFSAQGDGFIPHYYGFLSFFFYFFILDNKISPEIWSGKTRDDLSASLGIHWVKDFTVLSETWDGDVIKTKIVFPGHDLSDFSGLD